MADVALALPHRSFLSQFFTFRGRSNRANFWLSFLAILFGYMVVLYVVIGVFSQPGDALEISPAGAALLYLNWAIAIALVALAAVRRFHDRDKSGYWVYPLYVVPTLLGIADRVLEIWWPTGYSLVLVVPAAVLGIWGIVEVGFLRGTVGANRFGPDPLAK